MSAEAVLGGVGLGLSGLSALLNAMGVFKSSDERKREAYREYLEKNMPEFNYTDKAYTEADFADTLNPLAERQSTQQKTFGNSIGLRGLGRSGVGAEMVLQNERRNNQDYAGKLAGLVKEQRNEDYRRALAKYQMDVEKAKLMASAQ